MTKKIKKQPPLFLIDKFPILHKAVYVPQRFEDSTHQLWSVNCEREALFLKVCNNTGSPFWQIMQHLFDYNLRVEIQQFDQLYSIINELTPLQVPRLVRAEPEEPRDPQKPAYILTSTLEGSSVAATNTAMVVQLASHLAALHQNKQKQWGPLIACAKSGSLKHNSARNFQPWPEQLAHTLAVFSEQQHISRDHITTAINACAHIKVSEFVPTMPDLRWDQFLQRNDRLSALIDLDAFVLAPRELDFVLLEYILTPEQQMHFVQAYAKKHPVPDISRVRPAYRLLLFLMQVLGEQDINDWMNAKSTF